MRRFSAVSQVVLSALFVASSADAVTPNQGMAMHGTTKYQPDFKAVEYANVDAPKGGTLVIGWEGSFDTLNPYSVKGDSPVYMPQFVYQELGDSTLDEAFSKYPSLAEGFELAADKLSMTVTLRKEAKFSDGRPVTADDVVFSFKTFSSDKVRPFYKFYWADIKEVVAVDKQTVKFVFKQVNPELALITTELPILPKHFYQKGDFGTAHATKSLGSGPYTVKDFKAGSYITYKRNPKFWGNDLPLFKGRYNFDEITVKMYKNPTALVEGFKKGDFDFYTVQSSKVWALDLTGDRFEQKKWIKKELLSHENNAGTQGFIFNMRKPIFQDVRVRQAMALAFDFDWSNKNLFYGQYVENHSFFENSPLKATGMPSPAELAVLEPLKADLPAEVFTKEMGWLGKGMDIKARLRAAMGLLKDAGYEIKDGVATGPGGKLDFKVMVDGPTWGRIIEPFAQNLQKIGIVAGIEEKEESVYIRRIDNREYDVFISVIGQSQSPGNEQRDFWSSAAADQSSSRNYMGLKNKAIDALVDKIIYAKDRTELELMTKCLDRALYHIHPIVHNWHAANHRIAYWDKVDRPKQVPRFYGVAQLLEYMWVDPAKAKKLDDARAKNVPLL